MKSSCHVPANDPDCNLIPTTVIFKQLAAVSSNIFKTARRFIFYGNPIFILIYLAAIKFAVVLSDMNFLAHAYLSFGQEGLLTGNMISDFVKGKAQYGYPETIQKGIRLHRAIDAFTDTHHATKEAANFFKTPYRLYSGPIVDILYDHFLAADTTVFPNDTLLLFTQDVYAKLDRHAAHLPPLFARVFGYMKAENWLLHYKTREGIRRSLNGLARRATFISEGETAFHLFQQHYTALERCYAAFFPDVKSYVKQQISLPER